MNTLSQEAQNWISIILSIFLSCLGIWCSIFLYRKNSLGVWKRKLSKRLKFIAKEDPDSMDSIFTQIDDDNKIERKGFLLTTHAYWGYHRSGSAYAYNFIIPFITLNMSKEHEGIYVWICIDENGEKEIKESDLQKLYLNGKGNQHISDEILGSIERVKAIYEWYKHSYLFAKKIKILKRISSI